MKSTNSYKSISDYAFISDCHSAALVSNEGSIDWCCMPRFDSGSCFGRLLDCENGGFCSIDFKDKPLSITQDYIENSLVLVTTFRLNTGECNLYDFLAMKEGGKYDPRRQLVRIIECTSGYIDCQITISPRFDYGLLLPWIRHDGVNTFSAIGGSCSLLIHSDAELILQERHDLVMKLSLSAGNRKRLSLRYCDPAQLTHVTTVPDAKHYDNFLEETLNWWHEWSSQMHYSGPNKKNILRSASVLRGLCYGPTGAIIASPTTSLPEIIGGPRNWDYRYSWIRDSSFATRALANIGFVSEAEQFQQFIQRSSAGSALSLQIMYRIDGERRLTELLLPELNGYCGSKPVRIGNDACKQIQLDCYGTLLDLTWHWHLRGSSPDDDFWRFLIDIVDKVTEIWQQPDQGLWESRGTPLHFVHSKIMCWTALDRGIRLAQECLRKAPIRNWQHVRQVIRKEIETKGIDHKQGHFIQAFGKNEVDSALLLIPLTEFVDWNDPVMINTCNVIMNELDFHGLLRRYKTEKLDDGLQTKEGVFLPCTFWLVECLAHQGRLDLARTYFDRTFACSNQLGLFAEEYDPKDKLMLGNYPQGLSHLSYINAAIALANVYNMDSSHT